MVITFGLYFLLFLTKAQEASPMAGENNFVSYKPDEFPIIRVALGGYTTVVQTTEHRAYQWGIDHGEKVIDFPEPITSISCGGYHCLALSSTGTVYEWGQRDSAQPKETKPVPVSDLTGKNVVKISAGFRHNLAITDIGDVYIWGETLNGKVGAKQVSEQHINPTLLGDIPPMNDGACGGDHTILMDNDGYLWSLGGNTDFQLGRSSLESYCYTPMSVHGGLKVSNFSAGGDHTLLISDGKEVFSFGWGTHGQLGHGTVLNAESPTKVKLPEGEVPVQVATGAYGHSLVLTKNGNVYSFGINEFGQLGFDSETQPINSPNKIEGLPKIREVIGGGFKHSGVITEKGELILFGGNEFGQLGPKFVTTAQQWIETLQNVNLL